jgi:hypothetical protein
MNWDDAYKEFINDVLVGKRPSGWLGIFSHPIFDGCYMINLSATAIGILK